MDQSLDKLIYKLAYRIRLSNQIRLAEAKEKPSETLSALEQLVLEVIYKDGAMKISDINSALRSVSSSNISAIIKRMQSKSLVSKVRSVDDERVVTVDLTKVGREEAEKCIRSSLGMYEIIVTALNMKEGDGEVLARVINNAISFFDDFIQSNKKTA